MIPNDVVQQIIQSAEIVDVVSDFVSLSKKGANYMACCPFHNEKTPSFSVSSSKQIYKCFGCGKGGDSVRFVMDLEGFSYPEALRYLAKKYNIEVKEEENLSQEEQEKKNLKESLFIVSDFAKKYFHENLKSEEGISYGKSYFLERGFNEETIEKFQLGYSFEESNAFTQHALNSGYSLEILEKTGLTIIGEHSQSFDRFKGRAMFPIFGVSGNVLGFGGRILNNNKKQAKYLNSPESEIYHKSKILYGIFEAKSSIRQEEFAYLVEGYTDVISLSQAGIENVVSSSGTSLTIEQIQLLRRFTSSVTILFDGDLAGQKASLRGIDLILEEGLDVKVVAFPEDEDPDSYLKKIGPNDFKYYLKENSKDFIHFKTELSLKTIGNDPILKAQLIKDLVNSISKIPDGIKRAIFFSDVSNMLGIDEDVLLVESNKLIRTNYYNPKPSISQNSIDKAMDLSFDKSEIDYYSQENELVKDLVLYGNEFLNDDILLAAYIFEQLPNFKFENKVLQEIYNIYKEQFEKGNVIDSHFFTSHPNQEIQNTVIDWLISKSDISENWQKFEINVPKYVEKLDELAFKSILRLKKNRYEKDLKILLLKLENSEIDDEEELFKSIDKLKLILKRFANELGTIF